MTAVYTLWHEYQMDDGRDEEKLIGIYSTPEKANAAVEQIRGQPGFKDHPDGFNVYSCELDSTSWLDGFVTVYPHEVPDPQEP